MKLTVRRLPLLYALGFGVSAVLFLITRISALEAGLVLPVFAVFLLLVLYAVAYHLRKPVLIAMDSQGRGAAPMLAHLFAPLEQRRFDARGSALAYEPPYLHFAPPVVTERGERIERLYLLPKHVSGGASRIEAFLRYAQAAAADLPERTEP